MNDDRLAIGCIVTTILGGALVVLAFYGTIVWAIVNLVQWITGQ